ncbi:hypothetical protein B0T24DRAFT_621681 [Lasiosphaeria ovina]|uniref:Early meiotic induction protein 1 n=1 Tax=Lasiosphaeria ovina TaxID=92902 RepID=A0AAE0N825_9PEZI|nr:hypothetical protein B0T24DRAFT_621681 [Lasiosphaeria ovina]
MGWFWQSTSSAPSTTTTTITTLTMASNPKPAPRAAAAPNASKQANSNSDMDPEIQKFLEMLQEETKGNQQRYQQQREQQPAPTDDIRKKPSPFSSTTSRTFSSSWFTMKGSDSESSTQHQSSQSPPPPTRSPESLALSEVQLPETMSCRDAFDYAWHCHTVGSQWNAIYRYGTMRNCSDLWDDFWLCMRTRTYGAEQKAAAIKAHYRDKEEKKYGGGRPSSEDVWQSRREPAQPGEAFQEKFAPPVHDDVEYQLAQLERRRKIREELGIASRPQDDSDQDH